MSSIDDSEANRVGDNEPVRSHSPLSWDGPGGPPIVMSVPMPVSSNHLYANRASGGRMLSKEGKNYKVNVHEHLQEQKVRLRCPRPPYVISIWFMMADRRRRDVSNLVKALEDSVATFFHYDDSCHYEMHLYKALDIADPRAVIKLEHKSEAIPTPPDIPVTREPEPV